MEYKKKKNNKKKNFDKKAKKVEENKDINKTNDKVKYFLMIPFEQDNFVSTFNNMCEKLEAEKPKDYDINLLQKPQKLHITLVVLDIKEDKEKTEIIIKLINSLIAEMKDILCDELFFNFEKFDVFDSVKNAHVLFAKMIEDENHYKLKMITNLIIKNLVKENILDKKDLENLHINEEYSDGELIYVIKYHITLLNVKYFK